MAEIGKSELAKMLNMTRQSIYRAISRGKIDANSAGLIDTQNKKNQLWISSHGLSENNILACLVEIQKKEQSKKKNKPISNPLPKIREKTIKKQAEVEPEKIKERAIEIGTKTIKAIESYTGEQPKTKIDEVEFENITGLPARMMKLNLKNLVVRYGGPMMLKSWADILVKIMSANEKDQKIQERRLELIQKDFVISRLFMFLETLSSRIFDYTENIPVEIIALVKSGVDDIEIEIKKRMRKDFSILLKDTKENITRELENLKTKYEKSKNDENTDR